MSGMFFMRHNIFFRTLKNFLLTCFYFCHKRDPSDASRMSPFHGKGHGASTNREPVSWERARGVNEQATFSES